MAEEEVFLLKAVVDSYTKYSNPAHKEALDLASLKMKEYLGLASIPADKVAFLKNIIKDYIVLTR